MLFKLSRFALCLALLIAVHQSAAEAQDVKQRPSTKAAPAAEGAAAAKAAPAAPSPDKPSLPSLEEMIYLIRNLAIAINQANVTDNYSVLLALSAPEFRAVNTTEVLRKQFAALRQRSVDFAVTLAVAPQFSAMPAIDANGMLRLTGYFPTTPRITFDFGFKHYDGRWLPIGYGVGVINNPPPEPAAEPPKKVEPTPAPKKAPAR